MALFAERLTNCAPNKHDRELCGTIADSNDECHCSPPSPTLTKLESA